ncbi:helix-turn-helix domain-containing protein [Loigolactobacillus zhaoyuanensis]|uniref:Helix-turn-helix domain-containing protein n=1 Tax=Loigolactobacillus zhaoyuanensis TaxID=2486017 RepID=A0ABW8UD31_9LACO|nr:helix-turn-helix transcriptional regulator [Loigolactobacillus zhaoyuanensis]
MNINDYLLNRTNRDPEFRKLAANDDIRVEVAAELIKFRHTHNLTQQQFATLTGRKQSQIARIETGNANVTVATLAQLMKKAGGTLTISFS